MAEPTKEIYELQYMLRKISQITGEINKETWDKIFTKYKESIYKTTMGEPIYPFTDPMYTSTLGEKSDIITLIQLILSALSVIYDDFEEIAITGINDEATVSALKRFQSYHGLAETGVLDKRTWDAAAKSFNAYYNHPDYTS